MIKSFDEFKELATWCKSQKIKHLKVDGVEFEFSDIAFLEEIDSAKLESLETAVDESTFESEQDEKEDEEMLYWSAE